MKFKKGDRVRVIDHLIWNLESLTGTVLQFRGECILVEFDQPLPAQVIIGSDLSEKNMMWLSTFISKIEII